MKNKRLLVLLGALSIIVFSAETLIDNGRAGKTGSPGETTCADCHNNSSLNAGPGSIVITSNIPNWTYAPNQTYHITVTVSEAGRLLFGLGVEALRAGNMNAGKFTITNSAETQLKTSSGKVNVVHQLNGGVVSVPGSKAFTFDWTAPSADSGIVTFYAAGIAGVADADETDDNPYSTSQRVQSPSTVGVSEFASAVDFSVYPNPVKDVMNISVSSFETGRISASLFSLTGEKVADLFNETNNSGVEKHVPVSVSWAKGIYLVQVNQNGKSAIQRVIIQ